MRIFNPDYDHRAVGRWLRRQALKGFQRGGDAASGRYVESCTCGVNLADAPNSVSLIFTRDLVPECLIGWHLSVCCVTDKGYRGFSVAEGAHWRSILFGCFADLAIEQPVCDRSQIGRDKDVRHFIAECDWSVHSDPLVSLELVE